MIAFSSGPKKGKRNFLQRGKQLIASGKIPPGKCQIQTAEVIDDRARKGDSVY